MAPLLHLVLALCTPPALLAFVHTGAFRGPTSSSYIKGPLSSPVENSPLGGGQGVSITQDSGVRPCSLAPLWAGNIPVDFTSEITPMANSSVKITLDIAGTTTQACYDKAIRELSKKAAGSIPGFSGGNQRIPPQMIVNYYGAGEVKGEALQLITDSVIDKAVKDLEQPAIGTAKLLMEPQTLLHYFNPGEPFLLEVGVDVWPTVALKGPFLGLQATAIEPPLDTKRCDAAMEALQERYVILEDTADDYEAKMGDSVIANMTPFEQKKDGSKGKLLPAVASGDEVDIVMTPGRYMPGLAEGMEGVKKGETREIRVTFPDKLGPSGGDLEGKKALFEVECVEVKMRKLPELNDEFANTIRKGLTFEELRTEVENTVQEEMGGTKKDARNKALDGAIMSIADVTVPETLIVEQAREKFALMMTDFKDQGESDSKIRSMINKENFEKYVEVVRASTTRDLTLGLVYTYIAEQEGLTVDPREVVDQMDLIRAQAKGQEVNEKAAQDKIEASLQRDIVLDWVAERVTLDWKEADPIEPVDLPTELTPAAAP